MVGVLNESVSMHQDRIMVRLFTFCGPVIGQISPDGKQDSKAHGSQEAFYPSIKIDRAVG